MFDALRRLTLRLLRVPPEPQPPAGAPGSVRVFRAGHNFFRLKVCTWAVAQLVALAGALISLWFVGGLLDRTWVLKEAAKTPPAPATAVSPAAPADDPASSTTAKAAEPPAPKAQAKGKRANRSATQQLARRTPDWVLVGIRLFEFGGVALLLLQVPWTFAALRLDYEMRWYVVTDRSLRIRRGLLVVEESTLSFANIQQVVVTQGPLQRLLGLADVRVQSAGGGGGDSHGTRGGGDTLHTAVFHAVEDAAELRDLVLARLRQFRSASLGDPDDAVPRDAPVAPAATAIVATTATNRSATLAAARELLAEAQALRRAL